MIKPPLLEHRRRFVRYLNERLMILVRRLDGMPRDRWTTNPILREYKFCNVRRAWDRTTRWLIDHWYVPHGTDPFIGLSCAVARFIGHWPTLRDMPFFEWQRDRRSLASANMVKFLRIRKDAGMQVWTGAYMVTNGGSKRDKAHFVVTDFLEPLSRQGPLYNPHTHTAVVWPSCESVYTALRQEAGFGPFMAQEVTQDLILTNRIIKKNADQDTFAVLGPGARRGLNRLYYGAQFEEGPRYAEASGTEYLNVLRDLLKERRSGLLDELRFRDTLTAHDIEFNLCEFDKYERVRLGQGTPRSRFEPSGILKPAFRDDKLLNYY